MAALTLPSYSIKKLNERIVELHLFKQAAKIVDMSRLSMQRFVGKNIIAHGKHFVAKRAFERIHRKPKHLQPITLS